MAQIDIPDRHNAKSVSNAYHDRLDSVVSQENAEKTNKKGFLASLFKGYFNSTTDDIFTYLVEEQIKPRLRDLVFDSALDTLQEIRYRGPGASYSTGTDSRTRYSMSDRGSGSRSRDRFNSNQPVRNDSGKSKDSDWRDVNYVTVSDAKKVMESMRRELRRKGYVTVLDYCDLSRWPCDWTLRSWGWYNLDGIDIRHRGGRFYIIGLGEPEPIIEDR